jgi:hypothetical protein
MTLTWRTARVELVDGYAVVDTDGGLTAVVEEVRVAVEGGFLHVEVPGKEFGQLVSAPAVRRITYSE